MTTIETKKFETLLKDLKVGYTNQLAQLKGGLEQMLGQQEQLNENIPLLEAEIKRRLRTSWARSPTFFPKRRKSDG